MSVGKSVDNNSLRSNLHHRRGVSAYILLNYIYTQKKGWKNYVRPQGHASSYSRENLCVRTSQPRLRECSRTTVRRGKHYTIHYIIDLDWYSQYQDDVKEVMYRTFASCERGFVPPTGLFLVPAPHQQTFQIAKHRSPTINPELKSINQYLIIIYF